MRSSVWTWRMPSPAALLPLEAKPTDDSEEAWMPIGCNSGLARSGKHSLAYSELAASPDGHKLALVSESVSERHEKVEECEIY